MTTGTQLRASGQGAAIAADCSVTRGYGDFIRDAIEMLAAVNDRPWTCDTVRRTAERLFHAETGGTAPFDPSVNLLPALIGNAVGRKQIVRVSDATSTRRSRRAARVGRYLGAKYAPPH